MPLGEFRAHGYFMGREGFRDAGGSERRLYEIPKVLSAVRWLHVTTWLYFY